MQTDQRKGTIKPVYGWKEYRIGQGWQSPGTFERESEYSDKKGMFMHETGKTDHWILV